MTLRGKLPADADRRLKFLVHSPAGVGKTIAAIQMPKPYIIDTERGTVHYGDQLGRSEAAVYQTNDMLEVIEEVRSLLTTKHDYRTLVIDSFTPLYEGELDRGEKAVGSDWGRHYGFANQSCKRLFHLLTQIDMHVVITAHSKNQYGDEMKVIGTTFDGWKKLDYLFDLVFSLERRGDKRFAIVRKTRLKQFPDQSEFEWSLDALAQRYGSEALQREAVPVELAPVDLIARFGRMIEALGLDTSKIQERIEKAGAASISEISAKTLREWTAKMDKDLKAKGITLEVASEVPAKDRG